LIAAGGYFSGAISGWATGVLESEERNEIRAGGSLLRAAEVD